MRSINILLILVMLVFLCSCVAVTKQGTIENNQEETQEIIEETGEAQDTTPETETTENTLAEEDTTVIVQDETPKPEETEDYSDGVKTLLDKNKAKDNYRYNYNSYYLNEFDQYLQTAGYEANIRGNYVKKVYPNLLKPTPDIAYDTVYLDNNAKTAFGVCTRTPVKCGNSANRAIELDYEEEKITLTPLDVYNNIGFDAEVKGTERFEDRDTNKISYTNSKGQTEIVLLDDFYGVPIKQTVYDKNDPEKMVIENHFIIMNVGSLKVDDVVIDEEEFSMD